MTELADKSVGAKPFEVSFTLFSIKENKKRPRGDVLGGEMNPDKVIRYVVEQTSAVAGIFNVLFGNSDRAC